MIIFHNFLIIFLLFQTLVLGYSVSISRVLVDQLNHLPETPHLSWDRFDWLKTGDLFANVSAGQTSFSYEKVEVIPKNSLAFTFFTTKPIVKSIRVEKVVKCTLKTHAVANPFHSTHFKNIEMRYKFYINATYARYPLNIIGEIYLVGKEMPFTCPNCWRSTLQSNDASGSYSLHDFDLFDLTKPNFYKVVTLKKRSAEDIDFGPRDKIQTLIAEIGNRLDPMTASPSIGSASIRGAWLMASSLPSTSAGTFGTVAGEVMHIIKNEVKCGNGNACPSYLVDALVGLVPEGCTNPSPDLASIESGLSVDMSFSEKNLIIRSVAGFSKIRFNCNDTSVHVSLTGATTTENTIPLFLFEYDLKSAAAVAKYIPFKVQGFLDGFLKALDGTLMSVIGGNIFEAAHSGNVVPNLPWVDQAMKRPIEALFDKIRLIPALPVPALSNFANNLFPVNISLLVGNYINAIPNPTVVGFIQWFADQNKPNFKTYVWPNGSITLSLMLNVTADHIEFNETSVVNGFNVALTNMGKAVAGRVNDNSGTFSQILDQNNLKSVSFKGSVLVDLLLSNLLTADPTIDISTPQFSAVVKISAVVNHSSSDLFHKIEGEYDYQARSAFITAYISSRYQTFLGKSITLGKDGVPIFDFPWKTSSFLSSDLDRVVKGLGAYSWFNNLNPTTVNLHHLGDGMPSWEDSIKGLINEFAGETVTEVMQKVTAALDRLLGSNPNIVHHVSFFGAKSDIFRPSLGISISIYSRRDNVKVVSDSWKLVVDTSRTSFSFLIKTELSFTLGAGDPKMDLTAKAQCSFKLWTAPMLSGLAAGGAIDMDLDFPGTNTSSITISFQVNSDMGNLINGKIKLSGLSSDNEALTTDIDTSGLREISPAKILQSLLEGPMNFLNTSLTGSLSFPLPGFKKGITIPGYSQLIRRIGTWLSTVPSYNIPILQSKEFELSKIVNKVININTTVNKDFEFACQVTIDTSSLENVAASLTNGFKNCKSSINSNINLGAYVLAKVTSDSVGEKGSIFLDNALPGVVWSQTFSTITDGMTDFLSGTFGQTPVPVFSGWKDFVWVLTRFFSKEGIPIIGKLVETASHDIPTFPNQLRSFYPKMTTLQFSTEYGHHGESTNDLSTSIGGGGASLTVNDGRYGGKINASISFSLDIVFDGPPITTLMYIQTNFTTDNTENTNWAVQSGKNTFKLKITVDQVFMAKKRETFTFDSVITLTPGKTLFEALRTDIAAQIPTAQIKELLNITVVPANRWLGTPDQVQIQLDPKLVGEGYAVPRGLTISQSNVPFLGDSYCAPSNSRILFHNISASVLVAGGISVGSIKAKLGVVEAESRQISGSSIVGFSINSKKYMSLPDLVNAVTDKEEFFNYFDNKIIFDTTVDVSKLEFKLVNINIAQTPSIHLYVGKVWNITSFNQLKNLLSTLNWDVRVEGGDWLGNMLKINATSFCDYLKLFQGIVGQIQEYPEFKFKLPFSGVSLSKVFQTGIKTILDDAVVSTCAKREDFSLTIFCNLLKTIFKKEICTNKIVEERKMTVDLHIDLVHKNMNNQFEFNIQKLFGPLAKLLPIGIGSTGYSNLNFDVSVDLSLVTEFKPNGGISISLGPNFGIEASVGYSFVDSVRISFGPLTLPFGGLNAYLGNPLAKVSVKLQDGKPKFTISGVAGLNGRLDFGGNSQCTLNFEVASLDEFVKGNFNNVRFNASCGSEDFLTILQKALLDHTLLDFFSSPDTFLGQFVQKLSNATQTLIKKFKILKAVLPLLDKELQNIVMGGLRDILNPETIQKLTYTIGNSTKNLILNGAAQAPSKKRYLPHQMFDYDKKRANELVNEAAVLKMITKVLCDILHPTSCPPVPENCDQKCEWKMTLGRAQIVNLPTLKWDLGGSAAEFEADCTPKLDYKFGLTFTLILDRSHGVDIFLDPAYPIFEADAKLAIDGNTCHLAGRLGFLGAMIKPTAALQARFALSKTFEPEFSFSAAMHGEVDLGFAGLGKRIATQSFEDSIQGYLYVKGDIDMSWSVANANHVTKIQPANFSLSNVKVCLGSTISKFIAPMLEKINKIYGPINTIIGKDGFLQKKVPGSKFFAGKEITVAELMYWIYKTLCEDCKFDGVFEMLDTMMKIDEILEFMQALNDAEKQGECSVYLRISGYSIDWANSQIPRISHRKREEFALEPTFDTQNPKVVDNAKSIFTNTVKNEGKFGIKFTFFNDTQANIMNLMMGKYDQISLFAITIPKVTVSLGVSWSFLVWPTPPINADFGISCTLVLDIKQIDYLASGLMAMIQSKSPAQIWKGLALPAKEADGSPHWMIIITLRLQGGMTLDCKFVQASVYAFVEAVFKFRLLPKDPADKYITIVDLINQGKKNGIGKLFQIQLTFPIGVGLRVRVCLYFVIGSVCVTILKWEYKIPSLIPAIIFNPQLGDVVASTQGHVNLEIMKVGKKRDESEIEQVAPGALPARKIQIFDDSMGVRNIAYQKDSASMQTQRADPNWNGPIRLENPGHANDPWVFEIMGIKASIDMKECTDKTYVSIPQESYSDIDHMVITQSSVVPGAHKGMTALNDCAMLHMPRDVGLINYIVSGVPCLTNITSANSNFSFTGQGDEYNDKIHLYGTATTVASAIQQTTHHVRADLVTSGDDFSLDLPDSMYELKVQGHFKDPNVMTVHSIPAAAVLVRGSLEDDVFIVPDFSKMATGDLTLSGFNGVDKVQISMESVTGENTIISPSYLAQNKGVEKPNLIHFDSIEEQRIVHTTNTRLSNITVLSPSSGVDLMVDLKSPDKNNVVNTTVFGCDPFSTLRFKLRGGTHSMYIGGKALFISKFSCVMIIESIDNVDSTVIIDSSKESDDESILVEINDGSLLVYDAENDNHYFRIFYTKVSRFIFNFGSKSFVKFISGPRDTEFVFKFPTRQNPTEPINNVMNITATQNSVLIIGESIVNVGDSSVQNLDPLAFVGGLIAVKDVQSINLLGDKPNSPQQHYILDGKCLNSLMKDGGSVRQIRDPSPWFRNEMISKGFDANIFTRECSLAYLGPNSGIHIATGKYDDSFEVCDASIHLTINSGDGDDKLIIGPLDPSKNNFIDSGPGNDRMEFYLPLGPTVALLNDTGDIKVGVLHQANYPVAQYPNNTYYPVGPKDSCRLQFFTGKWVNLFFDVDTRTCDKIIQKRFAIGDGGVEVDHDFSLSHELIPFGLNSHASIDTGSELSFENVPHKNKRYITYEDATVTLKACTRDEPQRHYFTQDTTVYIGSSTTPIDSYKCGIWLETDSTVTVTLIIDARSSRVPLTWELDYSGSINVFATKSLDLWFQVLYENMKRVELIFSDSGSNVFFNHATQPSEYILRFPEKYTVPVRNHLNISSTFSPILVLGNLDSIYIGAPSLAVPPLHNVYGQIAISAKYSDIQVSLITESLDFALNYTLTATCLSQHSYTLPSQWFLSQLTSNGFPRAALANCPIAYANPRINLDVKTGSKDDVFIIYDLTANLNLDLGLGDDKVEIHSAVPSAPIRINCGKGDDVVDLYLPISNTIIWLGDDFDPDVVTVHQNNYHVVQRGNLYSPVGPLPNCTMRVLEYVDHMDYVYLSTSNSKRIVIEDHKILQINDETGEKRAISDLEVDNNEVDIKKDVISHGDANRKRFHDELEAGENHEEEENNNGQYERRHSLPEGGENIKRNTENSEIENHEEDENNIGQYERRHSEPRVKRNNYETEITTDNDINDVQNNNDNQQQRQLERRHSQALEDVRRFNEEINVIEYNNEDLYDQQGWTTIPLNIDSGPRHYEPKNNTIFVIQELSTSALIYFDGRQRQNYKPAYNWVVIFAMPKFQFNPFLVYIFTEKNSNCTVILQFPDERSRTAIPLEIKDDLTNNQVGYLSGFFQIQTLGVEHILIEASAAILDLVIDGNPSLADLSIAVKRGSKVNITELTNNLILRGPSEVHIDDSVSASKNILLIVGNNETSITMDTVSSFDHADYKSGCVNLLPKVPNKPPSTWFTAVVRPHVPDPSKMLCSIYQTASTYFGLKIKSMNATGLGKDTAYFLELIDGITLDVDDMTTWNNAVFDGTHVTFDTPTNKVFKLGIKNNISKRELCINVVCNSNQLGYFDQKFSGHLNKNFKQFNVEMIGRASRIVVFESGLWTATDIGFLCGTVEPNNTLIVNNNVAANAVLAGLTVNWTINGEDARVASPAKDINFNLHNLNFDLYLYHFDDDQSNHIDFSNNDLPATEFMFFFHSRQSNFSTKQRNTVILRESKSSILFDGNLNAISFVSQSEFDLPLLSVRGVIGISQRSAFVTKPTDIFYEGSKSQDFQNIRLFAQCLNLTLPVRTPATTNMCDTYERSNLPCRKNPRCNFLLSGNFAFNFTTGENIDTIEIINIDAPVWISSGAGDDQISITNFYGPLYIHSGPDEDIITLRNVTTLGVVRINGGVGDNNITINSMNSKEDLLDISSGNGIDKIYLDIVSAKSLSLNGGDGENTLNLRRVTIRDFVNITSGNGFDKISLEILSGSSFNLKSGSGANTINIKSLTILNAITMTSGDDADKYQLDTVTGDSFSLMPGGGDNNLALNNVRIIHFINTSSGTGSDRYTLDTVNSDTLNMNVGNGNNVVTLKQVTISQIATLFSGGGSDRFNIDTVSAISVFFSLGFGDNSIIGKKLSASHLINVSSNLGADTVNIVDINAISISMNYGDGDNTVYLERVTGHTTILTGINMDNIHVRDAKGSLIITTGPGDDTVRLNYTNSSISLKTEGGNDKVYYENDYYHQPSVIDLGRGHDHSFYYGNYKTIALLDNGAVESDTNYFYKTGQGPRIDHNINQPSHTTDLVNTVNLKEYDTVEFFHYKKIIDVIPTLQVKYLNITTPLATYRIQSDSDTIYYIVNIAPGTKVEFDGTRAENWTVKVNMTSFNNSISIVATPTSNCTLEFFIPSRFEKNVVSIFSNETFKIGNTNITTYGVRNMKLIVQSSMRFNVNGTPSDAFLVIDSTKQSKVNLINSNTELVFINVALKVSAESFNNPNTLTSLVGDSTIDLSAPAQSVQVNGNCISNPLTALTHNFNVWPSTQLLETGVSADLYYSLYLRCSVILFDVFNATILSENIHAGEVGAGTHSLIVNSNYFNLKEDKVWRDVSIYNNILTAKMDGDYTYTITMNHTVEDIGIFNIPSTVFDNGTILRIYCDNASNYFLNWNFVSTNGEMTSSYPPIEWKGPTCHGLIYARDGFKPKIIFDSKQKFYLNINTASFAASSTKIKSKREEDEVTNGILFIVFNDFLIDFYSINQYDKFTIVHANNNLNVILNTSTGPNNVLFNSLAVIPSIFYLNNETTTISSYFYLPILMYGNDFKFSWTRESFYTNNTNQTATTCVEPKQYGVQSFWINTEWGASTYSRCGVLSLPHNCSTYQSFNFSSSQHIVVNYNPDVLSSKLNPMIVINIGPKTYADNVVEISTWVIIPIFIVIAYLVLLLLWTFAPVHRIFTLSRDRGLPLQDLAMTNFLLLALLSFQSLPSQRLARGIFMYLLGFDEVLCSKLLTRVLFYATLAAVIITFFGTLCQLYFLFTGTVLKESKYFLALTYFMRLVSILGLYFFFPINFYYYAQSGGYVAWCVIMFIVFGISIIFSDFLVIKYYAMHFNIHFLWNVFCLLKILLITVFLKFTEAHLNAAAFFILIFTVITQFKWIKFKSTPKYLLFYCFLFLYLVFGFLWILFVSVLEETSFATVAVMYTLSHIMALCLILLPIINFFYPLKSKIGGGRGKKDKLMKMHGQERYTEDDNAYNMNNLSKKPTSNQQRSPSISETKKPQQQQQQQQYLPRRDSNAIKLESSMSESLSPRGLRSGSVGNTGIKTPVSRNSGIGVRNDRASSFGAGKRNSTPLGDDGYVKLDAEETYEL